MSPVAVACPLRCLFLANWGPSGLARLRTIGIIANADRPREVRADPPQLSDAVRFSLMLDEEDPASRGA